MNNRLRIGKRVTLSDIADELGLSKTTVSRVLSGKGRIGADTRRVVLECVKAHDYHPNLVAKGLAESKTWNIGVVLQGDAAREDMTFFQQCLFGIAGAVKAHNYDVLAVLNDGSGTDGLERILRMSKADAVILTRVLENDRNVSLLKERGVPFVAIGSSKDEDVVQVDAHNEDACRDFSLAMLGERASSARIAFLCGSRNIVVNGLRLSGFLSALSKLGIPDERVLKMLDLDGERGAKAALSGFDGDMVICADDILCEGALEWAAESGRSDVKIASFHDSLLLSKSALGVSAIAVDAAELGRKASDILLSMLSGNDVESKNYVGHKFLFR